MGEDSLGRATSPCHVLSLASNDPGREVYSSLVLQVILREAEATCPTSRGMKWRNALSSRRGF